MSAVDAIVAEGLTKRYGETVACDRVDLQVRDGSVHAILGENGAGKSSFVKMLFGLTTPDDGRLRLWGEEVAFRSPAEALRAGVGMVHQHFSLAPNLTAEENLALAGPLVERVDRDGYRRRAGEIEDAAGLSITYGVPVGELGVGEQQRVEIVRALLTGARLLILDEPTAVLSESEVAGFLSGIRRLAAAGTTVLLITHRMDDVFAGCDHVTVLRAGSVTLDAPTTELTHLDLVHAITGDRLETYRRHALAEVDRAATPALELRDVTALAPSGAVALDGVSLCVAPGEVVGVAGVEGNGQRQLCETITGWCEPRSGSVLLSGEPLGRSSPSERFTRGLALIPEDRHEDGLMLSLTSSQNYAPGVLGEPLVTRGRFGIVWRKVRELFAGAADRFDIRPADPSSVVGTLSGGNQQKVVVARNLAARPTSIVASQPTRGVDLGAAEGIRSALVGAAADGAGLLVVSADLDELFAMCHRIVVLSRGRIVWSGPCDPHRRHEIVGAMTGASSVVPAAPATLMAGA